MRAIVIAAILGTLVLIGGCDNGSDAIDGGTCSAADQNSAIKVTMQEWYLFNDQLRDSNPAAFADPKLFLADMVADVIPSDRFSFLISAQDEQNAIQAAFIGFGFVFAVLPGPEVRLLDVYGEFPGELPTPASAAGWKRGFRITAIEGVPVVDIINSRDPAISETRAISDAFGPREVGYQVTISYQDNAGVDSTVTLAKQDIQFSTVPLSSVFDLNGRPTGYLLFRSFADPSFAELDTAFQKFRQAGVRDLVVDVRYNGGGLVSVVEYIGDLMAGRTLPTNTIYFQQVFNAQKAGLNSSTFFRPLNSSLDGLDRVVFITTARSASASELVPNGLAPHVEVASVGTTSFGKPVGSYGFSFCGQVLRPVTFQSINALGQGDYFDGIAPTCPAEDDPDFALGDPAESSLAAALSYVQLGACPALPAAQAGTLQAKQAFMQRQLEKTPYGELGLDLQ
jgi:C-terminal processing protease CtpA/Prc